MLGEHAPNCRTVGAHAARKHGDSPDARAADKQTLDPPGDRGHLAVHARRRNYRKPTRQLAHRVNIKNTVPNPPKNRDANHFSRTRSRKMVSVPIFFDFHQVRAELFAYVVQRAVCPLPHPPTVVACVR